MDKAQKAQQRFGENLTERDEIKALGEKATYKDSIRFQELLDEAQTLMASGYIPGAQPLPAGIAASMNGDSGQTVPNFGKIGARSVKDVFGASLKGFGSSGFGSLPEFLNAARVGRDSRLFDNVKMAASEAVPSQGGFLLPSPMGDMILDSVFSTSEVFPRARTYPMIADTLTIPAFAPSDMSAGGVGAAGGLKALWAAEASALTPQSAAFISMQFTAKKLTIFSVSSNELVSDAGVFETALSSVLAEAAQHRVEGSFFTGTGAGQPLGFLNSEALITIAKETGQSADTINYQNIRKMLSRLLPGSYKNAIWLVNPSAVPEIIGLAFIAGTGGGQVSTLTFAADGTMRLLGLPVVVSEHCAALGDLGDCALVDLSFYGVGLRQEITIDTSTDYAFNTDQKAYRCKMRLDAHPLISKPYTPSKGATLSPFVTLAERA